MNVISLSLTSSSFQSSQQWRKRLPRIWDPNIVMKATLINTALENNVVASMEKLHGWNSKFSNNFTSSYKELCTISRSGGNALFGNRATLLRRENVKNFGPLRNLCSTSYGFRVLEEVKVGVGRGDPVVALESAIISHGMPFPHNTTFALHLQAIVRQQVGSFLIK